MTYILFCDPTDSTYGLLTSTGFFIGWHSSIDDFDSTSRGADNSETFIGTTSESWVIDHPIYNHLGTFSSIPTRDSHPELFL